MPPSVNTWIRIEPGILRQSLEGGLQAEVHDPLWLLTRQWQLGEFWGEDAGSPVQAWLRLDCVPLSRYQPGPLSPGSTVAGQEMPSAVPLEAVVEREPVRASGASHLRLAAEAGLHLRRLLGSPAGDALWAGLLARFALGAPPPDPLLPLDPDVQRFMDVVGRVVDGNLLAAVIRNLDAPSPAPDPVGSALRTYRTWRGGLVEADRLRLDDVVVAWLSWYDSLFSEPDSAAGNPAWQPDRLEYALSVAAALPERQAFMRTEAATDQRPARYGFGLAPEREMVLAAPEYSGGHLDWHSFVVVPDASLGARATPSAPAPVRRTAIPTPARFPGMPVSRYWEFEDARIDFGAVAAGPQQLAHLLLVEFGLVRADDWFVIPVDLPVGSISRVRWLVVADTFGRRTLVPSAREVDRPDDEAQLAWDMFSLALDPRASVARGSQLADVLFLPPALGASLHGQPIEEVVLLRDNLANMAWAVERLVESAIGRPLDLAQAHHRSRWDEAEDQSPVAERPDDRQPLIYRLSTPVPEHWLPLYPARIRPDAPDIWLLRGGMPRGRLLEPERGPSTAPLFIHEEELPAEGARVTRAFQYARWLDGSTHVWMGRRKGVGRRGEVSSGLRFDVLEPFRSPGGAMQIGERSTIGVDTAVRRPFT